MNKHMWMRVREPLNIVGKGVLRSGIGLDESVEQLLLNYCIKFAFDRSCNHSSIWFQIEHCMFVMELMAKKLQLSNTGEATKLS